MEEFFKEWMQVIDERALNHILVSLGSIKSSPIYPRQSDVFKAFSLCNYSDLKVVMVGQDPYPQKDIATGILFGNKEGTLKLSPSLELIKENVIDYTKPHNVPIKFDITLESWSKQGILMINSALTVEENKVGSHTMLWRPFISQLLSNISNKKSGIIYVLFGETAKSFLPYINKNLNQVFVYKHPAYYARLGVKTDYDIFEKINQILKTNNNEKINWHD